MNLINHIDQWLKKLVSRWNYKKREEERLRQERAAKWADRQMELFRERLKLLPQSQPYHITYSAPAPTKSSAKAKPKSASTTTKRKKKK